jgi:hypothetical protein
MCKSKDSIRSRPLIMSRDKSSHHEQKQPPFMALPMNACNARADSDMVLRVKPP